MSDITGYSAWQLAAAIGRGDLSCQAVVRAYLDAIAQYDPLLGAYQEVYAEAAQRMAARHDRLRARQSAMPLFGLPLAIKDLLHIRGRVTSAGSMHWHDRRASKTAEVVQRATRSGAIVIGKTRTAEFGLGTTGINQHQGTPRNPWVSDTHACPGGSSSGAAVAVSARMAPWAIGTDTGGSVRIPAAWCGVVGFKPSQGYLSRRGVVPLSPTLDAIGLITRTVADAALLFAALGGPIAPDCATACARLDQVLRGVRIAAIDQGERAAVEPDILCSYDRALRQLADHGARIVELKLPRPLDDYRERIGRVTLFEAALRYGGLAADPATVMDDRVRSLLTWGRQVPEHDYRSVKSEIPSLRAEFDAVFDTIDAFVTPTTVCAAYPISAAPQRPVPNRFTRFVNFLDLCAVAVPCGLTPDRRPCSTQIICNRGDEAKALEIAGALYTLCWADQLPTLAKPALALP